MRTVLHGQRDVARLTEQTQLIDKDSCVIRVVADRGHGGDVSHQRNGGKGRALLDDRVRKLDRKMERIAKTAAVAHGQKFVAPRKTFRHFPAQGFDLGRIFGEELFFHLHALSALAQNLVAKIFRGFVDRGPSSREPLIHGQATSAVSDELVRSASPELRPPFFASKWRP